MMAGASSHTEVEEIVEIVNMFSLSSNVKLDLTIELG